jgi:hypothetical protein
MEMATTGGIGAIRCPLTMEGSFHSATFAKVIGALIGQITRSTSVAGACSGGSLTINQEALPWHLRYRGFRGVLPTIIGIDLSIIGFKYTVSSGGVACTSITTTSTPFVGIAHMTPPRVMSLQPSFSTLIPTRSLFACDFAGQWFMGQNSFGTVTQAGNSIGVSVTLI